PDIQQRMAAANGPPLLEQAAAFSQLQLSRHGEAVEYLFGRGLRDPVLIEELGIGYAPGGSLHRHLAALGYALESLCRAGLISRQGHDRFWRRILFPCREHGQIINLYGRSIGGAFPHQLLPRSKGGLFAWETLRHFSSVILVEGLFDLAVLWQAGFRNTTCAIGTHLTPLQLAQLGDQPGRCVYLAFDHDANQAGQRTSPSVWSERNHETHPSGSAFGSPQRFPLSLARRAGAGSRLGQYFPRCPALAPTVAAFPACLRL